MSSDAKVVGTFEAKTNFAQIIKRVQNGERITITRRGVPIAEIVPSQKKYDGAGIRDTVAAIQKFRKGRKVSNATLRQMIDEGRRF